MVINTRIKKESTDKKNKIKEGNNIIMIMTKMLNLKDKLKKLDTKNLMMITEILIIINNLNIVIKRHAV